MTAGAIDAVAAHVRQLKASGLCNKDPPVVEAVAELKRLRAVAEGVPAPPAAVLQPQPEEAASASDGDYAAFLVVRKNRDSCIHWLLTFAQRIEKEWCTSPHGLDLGSMLSRGRFLTPTPHSHRNTDLDARLSALSTLQRCLASLADHAHVECRELAALAPRMLRTLDFSERHFLNLILPIERRHSRGLRDDDLLASFSVTTDDAVFGPAATAAASPSRVSSGSDGVEAKGAVPARPSVLPLVVVCDHLRSAFNVGSIFRTADCMGVAELLLCGYTATPEDAQVAPSLPLFCAN